MSAVYGVEDAIALLEAKPEPRRFTAVLEQLRLGRVSVCFLDGDLGVLTRLARGGYFATPFCEDGARAMAEMLPAGAVSNICDVAFAPLIAPGVDPAEYELRVYDGTTPIDPGDAKISMRPLSACDFDLVDACYDLLPSDAILDHIERGWLRGGYDCRGDLVGFIGEHDEGSMGMLEVFPDHRRCGYARALEAALMEDLLLQGRVPYCHVDPANEASKALQEKLGLRRVGPMQCWVEIP